VTMADAAQKNEVGKLPPRQPTFLARYPRNFKLAVLTVLVALAVSPVFFTDTGQAPVKQATVKKESIVHSAERPTARGSAHQNATTATGNLPALNDQDDRSIKLVVAPDPGLTDDSAQGSMPRIGEDGREPWQVYARPFNMADQRPRLAVVIVDLGLERAGSDAAITQLPANVTLAFDAQNPVAGAWSTRARQVGHETLLSVPMEPFDYPRSDPGSNTLLTSLPNSDNIQRLYTSMRQGSGYVGLTTLTGSRFTDSPEKMRPVLEVLKERGLMMFDARVAPHSIVMDMAHDMHVPAADQTMRLDQDLNPAAIDAALEQLEKDVRLNGRAICVTGAEPIVLEKLQAWLKELPGKGIALAPVSAMVQ
jgi:uncharacterized protein